MTRHSLFALVVTLASALPLSAQTLGTAFSYQGQLKESGLPANGLYDLQVCLYDSLVNPTTLGCAPDVDDAPVEAGLFTITLDFGAAAFVGQERFLELRVRPGASSGAYTALLPRQLVRPAPEALRANAASAAPWSGLTGVPAGFADGVDANSGGTVTSVAAGAGLSGGSITGSGTLSVDTALIQSRVSGNCPAGQYLRQVNGDGTVVCAADANSGGTVTSIATGTGLTGGPISSSGSIAIAAGGVGLAQINTSEVQARVGSACALGSYLRGINPDGSALCSDLPGVTTITVVDDPVNFVGHGADMAIGHDGLPVISYCDEITEAVKVAKCANMACTGSATTTTVVGPIHSFALYTSIAIGNDGLPVISYADSAGGLKVARCVTPACTGTATISTVDSATTAGTFSSIAVGADGLPVISYLDETDGGFLKVAKCTTADCSGAATLTSVDDPANAVGFDSEIAIGADGFPVISYQDGTAGTLKVAKCINSACTGIAIRTTVDDPLVNLVGGFTSIAIGSAGHPVISYYDYTAKALKVASCVNPQCTGIATITTVDDPANDVGQYSSIAIGSDGRPVISYFDETALALRAAKCANAQCTAAATISVIDDSSAYVGTWSTIAIGSDGLPIISYANSGAGMLKVAKCGNRTCQ